MISFFIEAFLLGLSIGPICLAYCGPVLAPYMASSDFSEWKKSIRAFIFFLLGRLTGYITFGFLIGLAGMSSGILSNRNFMGVVSIILGISLLFFGLQKNFPTSRLCKMIPKINSADAYSFLFGLLTGINLCPPFFAAIIGAGGTGSLFGSITYFIAFFFGTAIYFPFMLIFGRLSKIEAIKTIASISLILSGGWFLLKGILTFLA